MTKTEFKYAGPVQEQWDIPTDWELMQKAEAEARGETEEDETEEDEAEEFDAGETEESENQGLRVVDGAPPERRRKGRKPGTLGAEYVKPGDNARYLKYARVAMHLTPVDLTKPEQVQQRIEDYFNFCEQNDRKPNIVGMANWIGVDRETIRRWRRGEWGREKYYTMINRAINAMEEQWVDYMLNGKVNPASGIFIGKNHFQYKDQQDVILTPNSPLQGLDDQAAQMRIVEALPDEE